MFKRAFPKCDCGTFPMANKYHPLEIHKALPLETARASCCWLF